nr:putative ribonuclease H-like domain-containing protein [Tanacetum cinerariifolium]
IGLVVKHQNKTPYELFRGRTPAPSFMRPFGCHVTILNTLDHLEKFDRKADKCYFVGYSMNSKAFRVYNIKTTRVEENLHSEFLENKPIILGTNSNDFACTKDSIGAELQMSLNPAFENLNTEYPNDPKMLGLETIATYDDSKEKADFTNFEYSIHVSPTLTTKAHKNNPIKQSAFLYGMIEEEVYVCQPLGFEDPDHPNKVYKVVKALYGLHQAPRACQDKYITEVLRKFNFLDVKSANNLVDTKKTLVKDADGVDVDVHLYRSMIGSLMYLIASRPDIIDSLFELVAYTDSDYAGASLDRKSTTGGCQFLGSRLISWQCKKQTMVATFTTEAEYVAAASCCGQVLWIHNQMLDYG